MRWRAEKLNWGARSFFFFFLCAFLMFSRYFSRFLVFLFTLHRNMFQFNWTWYVGRREGGGEQCWEPVHLGWSQFEGPAPASMKQNKFSTLQYFLRSFQHWLKAKSKTNTVLTNKWIFSNTEGRVLLKMVEKQPYFLWELEPERQKNPEPV